MPVPRIVAVFGAAALALAFAAVVVLETVGGGASGPTVVADSVAVVDPASLRVVDSIAVARQPAAVAVAGRDVWVTSFRENAVVRVDARTLRVRSRIGLLEPPGGIAAGHGALWARTENYVVRIDPVRGRVTETILLPGSAGLAVAVGGGAVWAVAASRLYRIDPRRNAVTARTDLKPLHLVGVRFAEDALWVSGPRRPVIVRVDPANGRRRTYRVAGRVGSWDVGLGALWVGKPAQGAVSRIDLRSGAEVASIRVGADPRGVAVGEGAVWVAADDGLWRIDARTNDPEHLDLRGAPAASLAAPFPAAGRIWVTVW